ncbi:MAG: DUF763 domain-containing protein [Methanotrichaceae archaeon]|nr:DUF763 domain-containing protein [Methanotrichaceae archaeon]
MNEQFARRYHWLSDTARSFVEEPHSAICCQMREQSVLDMTAKISEENRNATLDLIKDGPSHLFNLQRSLTDFSASTKGTMPQISMPMRHELCFLDVDENGRKALQIAYELQPENYEDLIALKGIGTKKIRALALISELIFGARPSWKDPAKFSFAHGGKDGTPVPVDRDSFDHSIRLLHDALESAKLDKKEKYKAIKRLSKHICID